MTRQSPYNSMAATGSIFDLFTNTEFLSAIAISVFKYTNVVITAINELSVIKLFNSLSAAASVPEKFAY